MNGPSIVTISLSEIASSVLSEKFRPLQDDALGALRLINLDLVSFKRRIEAQTSLIVLNLPTWSKEHSRLLCDIRELGYAGPVLALVRNVLIWSEAAEHSIEYQNVKFLEKPFEDQELVGLARRILSLQSVHSRVHPRYELDQAASLWIAGELKARVVSLVNVSRGGACLKADSQLPISKGLFVTLNVQLEESEPAQTLKARVAWSQSADGLAGLEFVRPQIRSPLKSVS